MKDEEKNKETVMKKKGMKAARMNRESKWQEGKKKEMRAATWTNKLMKEKRLKEDTDERNKNRKRKERN